MNTIASKLHDFYKWNMKELFSAILGCFIFSFAVNIFIVPNSLYNGGILGIAQLIRSLLSNYISFSFDIAGIISFLINIPLLILAYKFISKLSLEELLFV